LNALIVTDANGQRLREDVPLQSIVSYQSKIHNPSRADTPEAVLQVDRNAAVHSLKPVENLYLAETLEPGAYVIGVHNYALRQLGNIIGPAASDKYRTFDDFKKMNPGYQKMEKALAEQDLHAGDPDGTPEKQAILARVDQDMNAGSRMVQKLCSQGTASSGVHYGITVYSYPQLWAADAKHPQIASLDELQGLFQTGFFATADFVFDSGANTLGYNGANVVADVNSEVGKLALGNGKAAHVALLEIVKDATTGKSKISNVIMLDGRPRQSLGQQGSAPSAMNEFRSQHMMQRNAHALQGQEPCPEPSLRRSLQQSQRLPMQTSPMPMQQPFPEASPQQTQLQSQPFPEPHPQLMSMQASSMPMQQPFPEPSPQQSQLQSQPFPEPHVQRMSMRLPILSRAPQMMQGTYAASMPPAPGQMCPPTF
jgi:hypothetical protein